MIDPELRLIAGLLYSSQNDQTDFYLRKIPADLFQLHKAEINWVYRYRENHRKYPSVAAFRLKFNVKLPRPSDPLSGLLEAVLDRVQYNSVIANVKRVRELYDAKAPGASIVKQYQEDAAALQTYTVNSNVVDRSESVTGSVYYRERFLQNQNPLTSRITTPWPSLNKLCPTFEPKDVFYLYARLSMGKTWWLQRWGNHLAENGVRTLIGSYEMSNRMMELRDECIRYGISFPRYLEGKLLPSELRIWRKAKQVAAKKDYPLIMVEPDNKENGFAAIEEAAARYKPQVILLDALYDANHPSLIRLNTDVSRNAKRASLTKALAKDTNTFVVGVLQSNRESEDKKGKTNNPNPKNIYNGDYWGQLGDYLLEITGQRGSKMRRASLTKGRNSGVGDYMFEFDLDNPKLAENHLNVLDLDDDAPTATFTR